MHQFIRTENDARRLSGGLTLSFGDYQRGILQSFSFYAKNQQPIPEGCFSHHPFDKHINGTQLPTTARPILVRLLRPLKYRYYRYARKLHDRYQAVSRDQAVSLPEVPSMGRYQIQIHACLTSNH